MSRIECFWLEPTNLVEVSLRRLVWPTKEKCSGQFGYHTASSPPIGRMPIAEFEKLIGRPLVHGNVWPHDDQNWPRACSCGYVFQDGDEWQCNPDELYRRVDTGELFTRSTAPAGAMSDVGFYHDNPKMCGPDGRSLHVKLPDGVWWGIDTPARDGGYWKRSGDVPKITARPSILTHGYHGFLTDGVLESC